MGYDLNHIYHVAVPTGFYKDELLTVAATLEHIIYLHGQNVSSVLVYGSTRYQHSLSFGEKLWLVENIEGKERFHQGFEIIFGISGIRQKEAMILAEKVSGYNKISDVLIGFSLHLLPTQHEAKIYIKIFLSKSINQSLFNELQLHQSDKSFCYQSELDKIFATSPLPTIKKAINEREKTDMGIFNLPLGN